MIHEYHQKQYATPYRSTVRLMEFIERILGDEPVGELLDAACGAGANAFHMAQRWPKVSVTGMDQDADLVAFARQHAAQTPPGNRQFQTGDLCHAASLFRPKQFRYCTFIHTLFLFTPEEYPDILKNLLAVTREWIFISSLFGNHNLDVVCEIRDYTRPQAGGKKPLNYVILDERRFADRCQELGVKEVRFEEFSIDIDLSPPAEGGLGTHTVKDAQGQRLQFSGPVFMPWKFAALKVAD